MKKLFTILAILFVSSASAQDDLMNLLEKESGDKDAIEFVTATFKTTRIINGHSVETPAGGVLQFLIGHRFGPVNGGPYEFFGLDQSTIRLGLEYGIFDRLTAGIGRSSFEKTFDGFVKYKILRQSTGKRSFPFTLVYFGSTALKSLKWEHPERTNYFTSRLFFTNQLLIARKFTERFSLQLTPTFIHRNLVLTKKDENDVYAIGAGGRFKITKRVSLNGEYYYVLPGRVADTFHNSAAIGFDIETGGHVFQLHFTNSKGMIEKFFVAETQGDISKGDIFFGFNISRVFTLKRKK